MLEGRGMVSDFEFRGHINMADSKACRKGLSLKAVINWKRTRAFSRAQQAPLFLN